MSNFWEFPLKFLFFKLFILFCFSVFVTVFVSFSICYHRKLLIINVIWFSYLFTVHLLFLLYCITVRWLMCLSTYFYLAYRCLALSKFFCHRGKHRCLNHPVYRLLIDQYLIILIILKNYPCLGLLDERHTVID